MNDSSHPACRLLPVLLIGLLLLARPGLAAPPPAQTEPEVRFEVQPEHPMLAPNASVEIRIRAIDKQGPRASVAVTARLIDKAAGPATPLVPDAAGWATYRFQATQAQAVGLHAIELRHPGSGVTRKVYIDLLTAAEHEAFTEAAARVKLPSLPAHLLFVGDSLTDLYRGQNYVDKLGFWLTKRFGSQVTVKNVGVGGDTITRVWQRMSGDPKSYRLAMYDNLFVPRPTHAFLFLGHNDSKLSSTSDYRTPLVATDTFASEYRQAIRKIQAQTKARVIVLSATSSVYEITESTAAKMRAKGKAHNLFGKPEALEQFNALARAATSDCHAEYLDVYEPTRRHPDKPALFTADGVHVSNLGNRLLALEILKYLGRE
jgi:lysophospholipase L1-like esterase